MQLLGKPAKTATECKKIRKVFLLFRNNCFRFSTIRYRGSQLWEYQVQGQGGLSDGFEYASAEVRELQLQVSQAEADGG